MKTRRDWVYALSFASVVFVLTLASLRSNRVSFTLFQARFASPSQGNQRNLVTFLAHDVDFSYFGCFLSSLLRTNYTGDILVWHNRPDIFDPICTSDRPYLLCRLLTEDYPFSPSLNASVLESEDTKSHLVRLSWKKRFFLATYFFLLQHPSTYQWVLMSDARDVFFQLDPFLTVDTRTDAFLFFLEGHYRTEDGSHYPNTIGTNPFNRGWIVTLYGEQMARDLGPERVSCSGTIMGSTHQLTVYLSIFTDEVVEAKKRGVDLTHSPLDQGFHNYILHRRKWPHAVVIEATTGPVRTIGNRLPSVHSSGLYIQQEDESVVSVIHQYSHQEDVIAVMERYYCFRPSLERSVDKVWEASHLSKEEFCSVPTYKHRTPVCLVPEKKDEFEVIPTHCEDWHSPYAANRICYFNGLFYQQGNYYAILPEPDTHWEIPNGQAPPSTTVYNLSMMPAVKHEGTFERVLGELMLKVQTGLTVVQQRYAPHNYAHCVRDYLPNLWYYRQRFGRAEMNSTDLRLIFFDSDTTYDHLFQTITPYPITHGFPEGLTIFPTAIVGNHLNGHLETHPMDWFGFADFMAQSQLGFVPQRVPGLVWVMNRNHGAEREISNEAELVEALRKERFQVLVARPGYLPFSQQIHYAHLTDIFVAPHGSNVANIVFASRGATLVEVHHPSHYTPWFRDQCRRAGLRYFTGWDSYDLRDADDAGRIRCDVGAVVRAVKRAIEDPQYVPKCSRMESAEPYMTREICR